MIQHTILTQEMPPIAIDPGLCTIHAEFITEHLSVGGEVSGPEARLSDVLNSSVPSVGFKPLSVTRGSIGGQIDLSGSYAHLTKSRLLFVVPVREPERTRGHGNAAWKQTAQRRCWVGIGPYSLVGTLHTEVGVDPRFYLRLMENQFIPIANAAITFPNGSVCDYPVVIVNRAHVDLLALR
jgi:hypothetical protein